MGVLQKGAELQTQDPREIRKRIQAEADEGREKYFDEWKIELQKKALEGDSRLDARERVKVGTHGVGENFRPIPVPQKQRLELWRRTRRRLLSRDNFQQPARVSLEVSEGERAMTKENNSLVKFHLKGIPPMPRDAFEIDIDANWILNVSTSQTRGDVPCVTERATVCGLRHDRRGL